jgi:hypothetical protein
MFEEIRAKRIRKKEQRVVRPLEKFINDKQVEEIGLKKGTKIYANELGEMYYLELYYNSEKELNYFLKQIIKEKGKYSTPKIKLVTFFLYPNEIMIDRITNIDGSFRKPGRENRGKLFFRMIMAEAIKMGNNKKITINPGNSHKRYKHYKLRFGFEGFLGKEYLTKRFKNPVKHKSPR